MKSVQQHRLATQTGITRQIKREGDPELSYVSRFTFCALQIINVVRNTGNSAGASGCPGVICVAFVKHVQNSSPHVCIILGVVFIHPNGVKKDELYCVYSCQVKGIRFNKSLSAVFGRQLKSLHLPCLPQYVLRVNERPSYTDRHSAT